MGLLRTGGGKIREAICTRTVGWSARRHGGVVNLRTGWFLKGSKNQLEKPVTRARSKSTIVGGRGGGGSRGGEEGESTKKIDEGKTHKTYLERAGPSASRGRLRGEN